MASVDWSKKCHGGTESKQVLRHCDKDMRIQGEHANKQIDKTRSANNWQMYDGYNTTCERLNSKLDELDKVPGANKRKDRVTMQCLEYPAPDGLPADKFHEWHLKVHDILREMYGDDLYFINSYEHFDEVHEYHKANGEGIAISRYHAHDCLIPLRNGKLNGKSFSMRSNIRKLNTEIQKMTKSDYGLDFMTGEKRKDLRTVEELKNISEIQQLTAELTKEGKQVIQDIKTGFNSGFLNYLKGVNVQDKTGYDWLCEQIDKWKYIEANTVPLRADMIINRHVSNKKPVEAPVKPVEAPVKSVKTSGKHTSNKKPVEAPREPVEAPRRSSIGLYERLRQASNESRMQAIKKITESIHGVNENDREYEE